MNDTNREAEIREREQAATPGPWFTYKGGGLSGPFPGVINGAGNLIAMQVPTADGGAFIAHAREDIPFLLDALERARERERELREALAPLALLADVFDPPRRPSQGTRDADVIYTYALMDGGRAITVGDTRRARALLTSEDSQEKKR